MDDIVSSATCDNLIHDFAINMSNTFEMSMVSELTFFLGLQVKQLDEGNFISQLKFVKELVKKFGLKDSKHVQTLFSTSSKLDRDSDPNKVDPSLYRSMIGNLLYMAASRLNISFSVGVCTRYQADPRERHVLAVKCIIRYVNSTLNYKLRYSSESNFKIACYTNADWAGNKDDRKSTSGGCFYVSTNLVSWYSKKQKYISLSSCEAEYIVTGSYCTQLVWMKQMLLDYEVDQGTIATFYDNTSTINILN
ncbi:secreted RxLR effector protein 161-like [Cornus florida]|uniref:secreted RxLR effector protein 161-like n=1 Tax=Cornus florida TaxID=4283 RepID=UPI002896F84D|nr:secreted RxLR effector protein 161-like [Cornus florida]